MVEGGMQLGRSVCICDRCVKLAQTPYARVAYCAGCRVRNGKHDPACTEQRVIA
jgi:hypothetical protein